MANVVDVKEIKRKSGIRKSKYDDEIMDGINAWEKGKAVELSGHPAAIRSRFKALVKAGQIEKDFKLVGRNGKAYVICK